MADSTDRFGLDIYQAGDPNWSHTDTVQQVDKLGIARGLAADRPTTGTYDDELYYAIDQSILWRWDSTDTEWQIAAGFGTTDNPIPKIVSYGLLNRQTLPSDESLYIPSDNSMVVADKYDDQGDLQVDGVLKVI